MRKIIDGNALSTQLRSEFANRAAALKPPRASRPAWP
jgi:hypothetical protein